MSYQAHWMGELSPEDKQNGCVTFLTKAGLIPEDPGNELLDFVSKVIELNGDRIRVFGDVLSMDEFFVATEDLKYTEKDFQKRVVKPDDAVDLLRDLRSQFADTESFTADALHDVVSSFVEAKQIKFGQIAPALRLSVTGKNKGADLFPTLELLGKNNCLARIDRAIGMAESMKTI